MHNCLTHTNLGGAMRVHVIKHVPFEGPGSIAQWAASRFHTLTESYAPSEEPPALAPGDILCVMGGPMAADDEAASPWLVAEKLAIAAALDEGVSVLGVCLGAQILAHVIGGSVARNPQREIGWYPVCASMAATTDPVFSAFPAELVVGHWHGDTFTLPSGTDAVLSSDVTANQAFSALGGRAVGLQFHLEWTEQGLADLARECADELQTTEQTVSTAEELLRQAPERIPACADALFGVLDRMTTLEGGAW